ncbi:hypothetical protein Tco_0453011 [Tanacetum coccineum]
MERAYDPQSYQLHMCATWPYISSRSLTTVTPLIMSSMTSAVTYTSVYTDSEPGRAFWGADDEEPVAPPSPDYIPGPENPQTPLVPRDEDEHEFLAEEQPLPGHITESDPEEDPEEHTMEVRPEFPVTEKQLPLLTPHTAAVHWYISESDSEKDPEGMSQGVRMRDEEYEEDEAEEET